MSPLPIDIQQTERQAFTFLQKGQIDQAIPLFEQIVNSGKAQLSHYLGFAIALASVKQFDKAIVAADSALKLDSNNLRALLLKADMLKDMGQDHASVEHYQYALKLAANQASLPTDLTQALQRGHAFCQQKANDYQRHIRTQLQAKGLGKLDNNSRFNQSLGLLFDNKKIYYQNPTRFYYPELPQIQFYDTSAFDWVKELEAKTDDIRAELMSVLNDMQKFNPYINSKDDQLGQDNQGLADNQNWSALFLWQDGKLVEENRHLFPKTIEALSSVPMPHQQGVAPMALFSRLAANTKIPPHNGALNTRLICHLPLIVPKNCGAIRVGNQERAWQEGKLLMFDDSIEHEAWNNSNEVRVVLLFEIWRPEITCPVERELILTLLKETKNGESSSL